MKHITTTSRISTTRIIAGATLAAMTLGSVATVTAPAGAASSKTWKKVAIGAAAVGVYGQLKHKKGTRNLGAAAAVGSYLMYKHAKKKERRRRY